MKNSPYLYTLKLKCMKKNYCLRVNGSNLFFKELESIKEWFKKCGVEEILESVEEEVIYSLDNLEYLIGEGEIEIVNECMLEMGDDYCSIELEEINFED